MAAPPAAVEQRMPSEPGGTADIVVFDNVSIAFDENRVLDGISFRLAKGETISHMADSMSLSVKTVSTYRTRVMEKMKLESNSDLTYYALKNGLIQ